MIKILKNDMKVKHCVSHKMINYFKKSYDFKNFVGRVSYNNYRLEKHINASENKIAIIRATTKDYLIAYAIMTTDQYDELCEIIDPADKLNNLNFMLHMQDYLFDTNFLGKFIETTDAYC